MCIAKYFIDLLLGEYRQEINFIACESLLLNEIIVTFCGTLGGGLFIGNLNDVCAVIGEILGHNQLRS